MTHGAAAWRAGAFTSEASNESMLRLVAKGERVLQAYEDIRDALRASNDRTEAALEDAEKWKAATHGIEAAIPLAYTHVLASARAAVAGEVRLDAPERSASNGPDAAFLPPADSGPK